MWILIILKKLHSEIMDLHGISRPYLFLYYTSLCNAWSILIKSLEAREIAPGIRALASSS